MIMDSKPQQSLLERIRLLKMQLVCSQTTIHNEVTTATKAKSMAATGQFMCQYCLYVLQLRTTVNTVFMVVHGANVYCPFLADGYR